MSEEKLYTRQEVAEIVDTALARISINVNWLKDNLSAYVEQEMDIQTLLEKQDTITDLTSESIDSVMVEHPYKRGAKLNLREYLFLLLKTMISEGESFSGKRPFGDSGWLYDIYVGMIKAKIVPGKLDEDGYVEELSTTEAQSKLMEMVEMLGE